MEPPIAASSGSVAAAPATVHSAAPAYRREEAVNAADSSVGSSGYGLPCAKCRTYYLASLTCCPVCKSPERVSPAARAQPAQTASVAQSSPAQLEQERERILRELKAQAYASHLQINTAESFRCANEQNHPSGFEPASVCQSCYDQLQGRADLMEAALHIDLKDATQVIYRAVWADPSDPTNTYQNAAQALLAELHKRAGISAVLGPLQPRPH